MSLSGNFPGCAVGAFVNGLENLSSFQAMIGKDLAVVLWYVHWNEPFPKAEAEMVYKNGSVPLITWEPWVSGALDEIAAGSFENYIKEFIKSAKDWGKPLFLRFAHEMNGNWYPWDGFHNNSDPEMYKKAWLYIYIIKKELEAHNISLVWCPNNTSQPDADWNNISAYYPGDQYVDWVGMDGYNWGYGKWQSFDSVIKTMYNEITYVTHKPLMIGEFASAEHGGNKADWIKDSLSRIKNDYPRIKVFCWFNINKERDWRINSSSEAQAAFQQAVSNSHFIEKVI